MACVVGHREIDQSILHAIFVEFSSGKRVSDRYLDRFRVEALCKVYRSANCLFRFAGNPTMKSPCIVRPTFLQVSVNRSAISTVAPFLMFFSICESPDS